MKFRVTDIEGAQELCVMKRRGKGKEYIEQVFRTTAKGREEQNQELVDAISAVLGSTKAPAE